MKIVSYDKALSELKKWKIDETEYQNFSEQLSSFLKVLKDNKASGARENKYQIDICKFLSDTFYKGDYEAKPYGDTDLGIFKNSVFLSIFELKTPSNSEEMVHENDFNRKAFHEIVWSYLDATRDITEAGEVAFKQTGSTLRNVVITNFEKYYVIKPSEMEKILKHNGSYVINVWKRYKNGQSLENTKKAFYKEIKTYYSSQNILDKLTVHLFDFNELRKTPSGKRALFRFFNIDYLLLEKRQKSYNKHTLKKAFYDELLYIAGLKEVNEGNSKLVIKIDKERTQFIAPQVYKICLEDKDYDEEKAYASAFQLTIIWLNRLLFLKLFEGQLKKINGSSLEFRILDNSKISDFSQLNSLFFDVLGKEISNRESTSFLEKYKSIPYLNSSLFELSDVEKQVINIKNLENLEVPVYQKSIIKGVDKMPLIKYIFDFFDNWDFGSSINETNDEKKINKIIDAAVLGLIFEKINGYQDGSFYTPSEITEFLAKQAVERLVISRYNERFGSSVSNLNEIKETISDNSQRKLLNDLINDLKFCDPAVGSGHFLVSLLNRIIATKSELGCLFYTDSEERITSYKIEVINDEILVKDGQGTNFSYKKTDFESQRMQKTLFNEKRSIIEKSLFGADLNPNAVEICRLRLWIELLKNSYYENGIMETLPNIDININVGDSLLGTYHLKTYGQIAAGHFSNEDKENLKKYKTLISLYKRESNKQEKKNIKNQLKVYSSKLKAVLSGNQTYHQIDIFENSQSDSEQSEEIKMIEWLLDFPDLLDDSGQLKGFDCIIGNPPFIQLQKLKTRKALQQLNYESFDGLGDIYCLFIELAYYLLNNKGFLCFITSNKWLRSGYGNGLRNFLVKKTNPVLLIDLGSGVFDNATVDSSILVYQKAVYEKHTISCKASKSDIDALDEYIADNSYDISFEQNQNWIIASPIESSIRTKVESLGTPLSEWNVDINYGIKTGANDVFIIDEDTRNKLVSEDPKCDEIIRPILRGRDIKRFGYNYQHLYLICTFPAKNYSIDDYPSVKNYLLSFGIERLEQTGKTQFVNGVKIISRKKTSNKWFETQDNINYSDNFYKQKIIYSEID